MQEDKFMTLIYLYCKNLFRGHYFVLINGKLTISRIILQLKKHQK